MRRDALISPCGQFRYYLIRQWDTSLPVLFFVMLNPSTADALQDDPTIKACIRQARAHGYGGICVLNLYAYRATKPADLKAAGYPVGPLNDAMIAALIPPAAVVVCAWGANGRERWRASEVLHWLRAYSLAELVAIGFLADGTPRHPLFQPVGFFLASF